MNLHQTEQLLAEAEEWYARAEGHKARSYWVNIIVRLERTIALMEKNLKSCNPEHQQVDLET
jgi:hypothetical protein